MFSQTPSTRFALWPERFCAEDGRSLILLGQSATTSIVCLDVTFVACRLRSRYLGLPSNIQLLRYSAARLPRPRCFASEAYFPDRCRRSGYPVLVRLMSPGLCVVFVSSSRVTESAQGSLREAHFRIVSIPVSLYTAAI